MSFPGGSVVKNLLPMQELQVRSPGREDPLEEDIATHSSILAWEIPWTEEPGGYSSWVTKESDITEGLNNNNENSYIDALASSTSEVTLFGGKTFKEVIELKWSHSGGA